MGGDFEGFFIDKDDHDHWVEYTAFFTHGKLDRFELVKYEKESNTQPLGKSKHSELPNLSK